MSGADVLATTTKDSLVVETEIEPRLARYIATRDRRVKKDYPWESQPMTALFRELLGKGVVRVGGRATCGPHRDPTWTSFQAWCEIVSKARKCGYEIEEQDIKHGNGWATKAGGFWTEREYRIASVQGGQP